MPKIQTWYTHIVHLEAEKHISFSISRSTTIEFYKINFIQRAFLFPEKLGLCGYQKISHTASSILSKPLTITQKRGELIMNKRVWLVTVVQP